MSSLYATIAAKRIQQYLARTPRLRDRRGASAQLTAVTDENNLRGVLAGRAHVDPDAGQADGVVHLIVDEPAQRDAVIGDVLVFLRQKLPAAQFEATFAWADDYVAAEKLMRGQREGGGARSDLPAISEFPFAAPCRLCRSAPAVGRVALGEGEERDACADCVMRHSWTVRSEGAGAERRLSKALGLKEAPEDFETLARLGGRDTDRNHLATVYADGNGIGDFFNRLDGAPPKVRAKISRQLSDYTRGALEHATRKVARDDDGMLCAVPHVVGGDDVLVTVPADRAWQFTRAFLADLCAQLAATAEELEVETAPTVSAGIVISHATYPFHLVVEEAAAGLKTAKRAVAGQAASVQFHDVTVDGVDGPRLPGVRLDTLENAARDLDRLRAVPQSGRARLAEALDDGQGTERARNLAVRLRRADAVEPFLPGRDEAAPPIDLAHALRIVRWWR
jgi:hypothetical protein